MCIPIQWLFINSITTERTCHLFCDIKSFIVLLSSQIDSIFWTKPVMFHISHIYCMLFAMTIYVSGSFFLFISPVFFRYCINLIKWCWVLLFNINVNVLTVSLLNCELAFCSIIKYEIWISQADYFTRFIRVRLLAVVAFQLFKLLLLMDFVLFFLRLAAIYMLVCLMFIV